jgi:hypothetical protein
MSIIFSNQQEKKKHREEFHQAKLVQIPETLPPYKKKNKGGQK